MMDQDLMDDWLRIQRDTPLDSLRKRVRYESAVVLDAKRSFKNGCMVLSVWGYPKSYRQYGSQAQRIRLEGAVMPSNTPKEQWQTALRSMVLLVVARLGAEHYTLRSKIK